MYEPTERMVQVTSDATGALLRAWHQLEVYDQEEDVYLDAFQKVLFRQNLLANLRVVEWLLSNDYEPFPFYIMKVPKKSGYRPKAWLTPQDGVIVQSMINRFGSALEGGMLPESLGYRLDLADGDRIFKPWQDAYHVYRARMERFTFLAETHHFVKSDLSDFYPSINIELLEAEIGKYISDPSVLRTLRHFLWYRVKDPNTDQVWAVDKGVPQGPPYARVLANLYLGALDRHLKKTGLTFARYVDDFVILYGSRSVAEQQIAKIDWVLEDLQLKRSVEKTTGPAPVTDGSLLLDEVLRMRSEAEDLLHGVEYIDGGTQREKLADGLYNYFNKVIAGQEKDLLAAAKWLSFVLRHQLRLLSNDSPTLNRTINDVQTALTAGLQNIKTLRSLFRHLLKCGNGNFPNRKLYTILLQSESHAKIAFCEICSTLNPVGQDTLEALKTLSGEQEEPFVRGAALMALYQLNQVPSPQYLFNTLQTPNSFLQARALLCLSLHPDIQVYSLMPHVQSTDPEVVAAALQVVLTSGDPTGYLLLRQVPIEAFRRVEVITLAMEVAVKIGRLDAISKILADTELPSEVIEDLLEFQIMKLSDLPTLAGVWYECDKLHEGLREKVQENVRYRLEALYPPGDARPASVTSILDSVAGGWPEVDPCMAPVKTAGVRYFRLSGAEWRPQERISAKKILPPQSPEEWIAQRSQELAASCCPFTYTIQGGATGPYLVINYQVPDGYRLLADVLRDEGPMPLTHALQLTRSLLSAANLRTPLDPYHILINPKGEWKLFGLGSVLVPATYSGPKMQVEDTSPNAQIRFLGLLCFHMVTGTCPLSEEQELTRQRSGSRVLVTSPKLEPFPHLRKIIGKCIEPDYRDRYAHPSILLDDLDSVVRFVAWKNSGLTTSVLPMAEMEHLHSLGLTVKHMLASDRLRQNGSVFHVEELAKQFLQGLIRSGRSFPQHRRRNRPRLKSSIMRLYLDASGALNSLYSSLATEEWAFIHRVSAMIAYWALRVEFGRVLRGIAERESMTLLRMRVESLASEILASETGSESMEVTVGSEVVTGVDKDFSDLEKGLAALERTDHHKYRLANAHELRTCALFLLLSGLDKTLHVRIGDRSGMLQCSRRPYLELNGTDLEWLAVRLWTLQPDVATLLNGSPMSPDQLREFSDACWESVHQLEKVIVRPRFSSTLARSKRPGEMAGRVHLFRLWFSTTYGYNHVANIDPESERPVARDTLETVEVDLKSWKTLEVSALVFEPMLLRTLLGSRPTKGWTKAWMILRRHAPRGILLLGIFLLTVPHVISEDPKLVHYLMTGLSVEVLAAIVDFGMMLILNREASD